MQFYTIVCRVATILKTRYTSPGFWNAGLNLFQEAEQLVSDASERKHLQSCIAQARDQLGEVENLSEDLRSRESRTNGGARASHLSYMFVLFLYTFVMCYIVSLVLQRFGIDV